MNRSVPERVCYFAVQSDALFRSPADAAATVQYGVVLTAPPWPISVTKGIREDAMNSNAMTLDLPVLLRGEPKSLHWGIEEVRARQVVFYLSIIVVGAGCFGAAMGCWRAPLQAAYTALKLPLAILLTTLGNALLNSLLGPLFGLNL
ncbi:MAG TPA: hypothetical protein VK615_11225, partial [Candidatus Binatia bacterium]|nr:hypothetical protein [Candidatus Binatia bacterium]